MNLLVAAGSASTMGAALSGDNIVTIVLGLFTAITSIVTAYLTRKGNQAVDRNTEETRKRRVVVTGDRHVDGPTGTVHDEARPEGTDGG